MNSIRNVSVSLFVSLLLVMLCIPVVNSVDWEWEGSNTLFADGGSNNYHQHSTILLDNGSILCTHYDYPEHSAGGNVSYHVSHDNGSTWHEGTMIWDGTVETKGAVGNSLGIAPNGTVVCFIQCKNYDGSNYYPGMVKRSYDNGVTWTDAEYIDTVNNWDAQHCSSNIITKGNTMYAPVYNHSDSGRNFSIYVSTDNGSTWSKSSIVYSTSDNDYSYSTLAMMSDDINNGSFIWMCHYDPTKNYYRISHDNCTTWDAMTAMDTTNIRDPDLNVMFDADGSSHYFLHGRNKDDNSKFSFWYSTDGVSWQNETDVDSGGDYEAYSSGCSIGNDLFLTYSHDGLFCNLHYTWIYNVTNITDDDDDEIDIEFISIDGGGNGTAVLSSTPTFNWTVNESAIWYQFQIANDSGFSDVVVDLTDVSEDNYPTEYDENATRVSFTLPATYQLTETNVYYCRVRAVWY